MGRGLTKDPAQQVRDLERKVERLERVVRQFTGGNAERVEFKSEVGLSGNRITDVADPKNNSDALTKGMAEGTFVSGPASATDNAVARYDGVTGKLLQDSGVIMDDSDNITGVTTLAIDVATGTAPLTIASSTKVTNLNADLLDDLDSTAFATAAQGATADAALPRAGGEMSGNITMAGAETVDGRDISVDGAKLDGIGGGADVVGPGSSTDNAIARYDGTTGKIIQNSGVTVDDDDNVLIPSGQVRIGASPSTLDDLDVDGAALISHTAVEADDHALEIDCDAAGFGDVKAIDVEYVTGGISTGSGEAVFLANVDETSATGGDVMVFEALATEGGADKITGLFAGVGVGPVEQLSGDFGDADTVDNNGSTTTALDDGGAGNVAIFTADNDYMITGSAAKFEELEFLLDTVASGGGIAPDFEYSTGVGTWGTFSPVDGTNGMRSTGVIAWLDSDIPSWAVGTGSEYLIRITRTRNNLGTTPIADKLQVSAATEYYWDKDGDIKSRTFESDVTTGTAPLVVASTTKVTNLNVDQLDGNEATAFATAAQGATADTALQDVVDDTTPQLGGGLDLNDKDFELTGGVASFVQAVTSQDDIRMEIAQGQIEISTATWSNLLVLNPTMSASAKGGALMAIYVVTGHQTDDSSTTERESTYHRVFWAANYRLSAVFTDWWPTSMTGDLVAAQTTNNGSGWDSRVPSTVLPGVQVKSDGSDTVRWHCTALYFYHID